MSLATRCPACGTIFRVVQDQLKVSEGWVRCGQCHEVFHGIEALFDLDSDPTLAARRTARGVPAAPPPSRVFGESRPPAADGTRAPESRVPAAVVAPSPTPTPSGFAQSGTPRTTSGAPPPTSGFTPARGSAPMTPVAPSPVVPRGTIAPRFAARLAEESARAQANSTPSPIPSAFPENVPGPAPFGGSFAQRVEPSWESPAAATTAFPRVPAPEAAPVQVSPPAPSFAPVPAPAFGQTPVPAPAFVQAPMASPAEFRAPVVAQPATVSWTPPAPPIFDVPPPPASASAPSPTFAPSSFQPGARDASPTPSANPPGASELADSFAAPAAWQPVAMPMPAPQSPAVAGAADPVIAEAARRFPAPPQEAPATAPAAAPKSAPAPDNGGSALPSMLADDAADEDDRGGPPTLASMLPEDAGEWPPRPKPRKRTVKTPSTAVAVVPRDDPRFLREAKSGARWRRPWVRAVLGVALVLLIVTAAGQLAWPQRDTLAARWPATLPAWTWLCEQADCKIEAPRAIASLALDGSSLTRTDTDHVLLFSADLHNRADHDVRMPSFDLTFMDLNGEIVARKVLTPEQIGIDQAALAPEAELHVHARLQVGSLDASGFQANLFYP